MGWLARGVDPRFGFRGPTGQVECRRRKNGGTTGAEYRPTWVWGMEMGVSSNWGRILEGGTAPHTFFSFLSLEMHILAHSPAHLSIASAL